MAKKEKKVILTHPIMTDFETTESHAKFLLEKQKTWNKPSERWKIKEDAISKRNKRDTSKSGGEQKD